MGQGRDERGEGGIKVLITLVVVVYGVFCAIRVVPTWSADKEIKQKTEEVLKFAGTNRYELDDMHYQIFKRAQELDLPLTEEDIEVIDDGKNYVAKFSYEHVISLVVYTYRKPVTVDVSYQKY